MQSSLTRKYPLQSKSNFCRLLLIFFQLFSSRIFCLLSGINVTVLFGCLSMPSAFNVYVSFCFSLCILHFLLYLITAFICLHHNFTYLYIYIILIFVCLDRRIGCNSSFLLSRHLVVLNYNTVLVTFFYCTFVLCLTKLLFLCLIEIIMSITSFHFGIDQSVTAHSGFFGPLIISHNVR